jgi:hypothetical protein
LPVNVNHPFPTAIREVQKAEYNGLSRLMSSFDKAIDDFRNAVGPPSSPMEKLGSLVLGLAVGYFVPYVLSHLLIQGVRLSGADSAAWRTSAVVFSYLSCIPLAWLLWRRRYLAVGIVIPALIQLLIVTFALVLWLSVRTGH